MTPDQFKRARGLLGYSQKDVARHMYMGKNGERTVRRWELAEREIPGPVIALMEAWLGYPIEDLPDPAK